MYIAEDDIHYDKLKVLWYDEVQITLYWLYEYVRSCMYDCMSNGIDWNMASLLNCKSILWPEGYFKYFLVPTGKYMKRTLFLFFEIPSRKKAILNTFFANFALCNLE